NRVRVRSSMNRAAAARLLLRSDELEADPAHPASRRIRPGEVDEALVPDFGLQRHLRPAVLRGERHLDPGPERKRLAGLDEHPGVGDVAADPAGNPSIALEKYRKSLVESAHRARLGTRRFVLVSPAG